MSERGVYLVGGAVRDALLGLASGDRDWVVVGSTPEEMMARGYLPVGRDFPVFLHPQTHEEYALARTERKSGRGYRGFVVHAAPDVTLEADLARRDLTINSIAAPPDWTPGKPVIDPYNGVADLHARVLRHVTDAFREDPVRILRVARFAARFADFSIAPETLELMREMVAAGEADHLVPERVWQELARGLMEHTPSRMFDVLRACGALAVLLPELDRLWGVPQRADHHPEIDSGVHVMMVLDMSARLQASLPVRFACLTHDLGKGEPLTQESAQKWGSDSNLRLPPKLAAKLESDPDSVRHYGHEQRSSKLLQRGSERLRVPTECRDLADVVAREHGNIHRSAELGAAALLRLLERCDALRKPQRFADVLLACECDARGRLGLQERPYPQRARLMAALEQTLAVDTAALAAQAAARGAQGAQVGEWIRRAREQALADWLRAGAAPPSEI